MSKPVALITGGGKRIGAAISKKLMEMGWYVLIHVNSSVEDARKIISDFSSKNGGVDCGDVLTGNLLVDLDVESLILNVINHPAVVESNGLSGLIHNASIYSSIEINDVDVNIDIPENEDVDQ